MLSVDKWIRIIPNHINAWSIYYFLHSVFFFLLKLPLKDLVLFQIRPAFCQVKACLGLLKPGINIHNWIDFSSGYHHNRRANQNDKFIKNSRSQSTVNLVYVVLFCLLCCFPLLPRSLSHVISRFSMCGTSFISCSNALVRSEIFYLFPKQATVIK